MNEKEYQKDWKEQEPENFESMFHNSYGRVEAFPIDNFTKSSYWANRAFFLMGWLGGKTCLHC